VCGVVLGYSRKLFIQYTLHSHASSQGLSRCGLSVMDGACPRCIIDNTSVHRGSCSGPEAEIAPEMERFGQIFESSLSPMAVRDGRPEGKNWSETSSMWSVTFLRVALTDWHDSTSRPKMVQKRLQPKLKRSLGMSPEAAYLMEKHSLLPSTLSPACLSDA